MKTNYQTKKGTALITGASSGIGATYADRLAKRGYDLILVARDQKKLESLAKRLTEEAGVQAEAFQADLTSKADLARVEKRLRNDEQITLLVNNAGMSVEGSLVGGDLDRIETMIQLNVTAPTRLAGAVAPVFVSRGSGTIVNISSVLALAPELFGGRLQRNKGVPPKPKPVAPSGDWSKRRQNPGGSSGRNSHGHLGEGGEGCLEITPGHRGDGGRRNGRCGVGRFGFG